VPEGLSASEVGKEMAERRVHPAHAEHDRIVAIIEAVMLAVVALLAAYSGYAAAKWGTRSSVSLASASAARTKANQAHVEALQIRTLDSVAFNAWLAAFTSGDPADQRVAERRLRPGYRPAFRAWLATDPAHNPNAPAGPGYMPQYRIPQDLTARFYDAKADAEFSRGSDAGDRSDKYIRVTVFLATVLFLVGIASHFQVRQARLGLVGVAGVMLVFSVVQLLALPGPPGGI